MCASIQYTQEKFFPYCKLISYDGFSRYLKYDSEIPQLKSLETIEYVTGKMAL